MLLEILQQAHNAGTHYAVFPIALALMAAQAIYSGAKAAKAAKDQKAAQAEAERRLANMPTYNNPAVDEMLADARTAKSAVSPTLAMYQRQLQQYQANQIANAQRNAPSGATALAVGSAAQSVTAGQTPQLAKMQDDYEAYNTGNYYKALANKGEDNRAKYSADMDKSQSFINYSLGKAAAAGATKGQAISGVISAAGGAAAYGQDAQKNGMFDKAPQAPLPDTPAPAMSREAQTGYNNINNLTVTPKQFGSPVGVQPMGSSHNPKYGEWFQKPDGTWSQYFGGYFLPAN